MRNRTYSLVTLTAVLATGLVAPSVASAEPHCASGWRFTDMRKKRVRLAVQERRRIENNTNRAARVTFTSRKSKTVKMSASLHLEASYNAIFTSVKASIDVGVEKAVSSEIGEAVSFPLPRKRVGHGRYGVFIRPVTGRLTRGSRSNQCLVDRRITAYLPRASGWRVSVTKD